MTRIVYPREWLELPCRWCGKSRYDHGFVPGGNPPCHELVENWQPLLPASNRVDCECKHWAFDDDIAAIWPEAGDAGKWQEILPGGHHPSCEHYAPPPTVELTRASLERRLKRLGEYVNREELRP